MLSTHENATYAMQSISSGAKGYVAITGDSGDLIKAVNEVYKGKSFLSTQMTHKVALQGLTGDDNPTLNV
jgi:DNA-binding NarL/FixJ family response regulator